MIIYTSFCKFFTTFTFDVDTHLQNLSNDANVYSKNLTSGKRLKMLKMLKETIQFHGETNQLSSIFYPFDLLLNYNWYIF